MALHALDVERFRAIREAHLTFDDTTLVFGENGSGKSSLLEAVALVLSPFGGRRPRVEPWHFHRDRLDEDGDIGPMRIEVTLVETSPGSWNRDELAPLRQVVDGQADERRRLVVRVNAVFDTPATPGHVHWEIGAPGGLMLVDDEEALAAVRRMNPLVWMRSDATVRRVGAEEIGGAGPGAAPRAATATAMGTGDRASSPAADMSGVVSSYERVIAGSTPSEEAEIEAGYAAAERLLAAWAPMARLRAPNLRAAVSEVLGRRVSAERSNGDEETRDLPGVTARKLGVFLVTARLFQQLQNAAPGVKPIVVIEELESGLHPMTLASAWELLERLSMQKIVSTNSGSLLAAAPLSALRRIVRDDEGVVREWKVPDGTLGRDDLRRVSYHLRARRGAACFARCWLLVEGETEFWILPDLARLCGYDFAQEGIACVEFAQCGLRPLVRLARALGIEWHVLADGDRAGQGYAESARAMAGAGAADARVTLLDDRDVEHCFWFNGHAAVFERLAGFVPGQVRIAPRRIIERAIARHSKPGVAFELLAAVADGAGAGPPAPLARTIETCVRLARGAMTASAAPRDARRE